MPLVAVGGWIAVGCLSTTVDTFHEKNCYTGVNYNTLIDTGYKYSMAVKVPSVAQG